MLEMRTLASVTGRIEVGRAPEGFDALVATEVLGRRGGRMLFLARDDARAAAVVEAAAFFAPKTEMVRLPAWDCQPYDRVSPSAGIAAARTSALARLAEPDGGAPVMIVATVGAALQRCAPRAALATARFRAKAGSVTSFEALKSYLRRNGYVRVATVVEPGDYAIRGGVADVFPPGREEPVRLDFFGDELESIRAFDPDSQRTTKQLTLLDLAPVSEILLDEETIARFRRGYVSAFGAVTEADPVYEAVSTGARAQGAEHFLPLFFETLETLFDYAGPEALIALDPLAERAAAERLALVLDYHAARKEPGAAGGGGGGVFSAPAYRALPPEKLYLVDGAFERALAGRPVLAFSPFAAEGPRVVDLGARVGRDFAPERQTEGANVFDAAATHIREVIAAGRRVIVASWTEGSSERTAGVLADHGLAPIIFAPDYAAATGLPAGAIARAVLPLERGFETDDLVVLSEQDILGDRLARTTRKRRAQNFISEISTLSAGDLVVHVDHGVGRYLGLRTLEVQGARHDCLEVEYAGTSKLFLPVENLDLLSRYGPDDGAVQLDKLGGAAWQARKAKAKQRLRDMAEKLIALAAAREVKHAPVIELSGGVYEEFCARFPYAETDDQLSAIEDAFGDLASGKPMDRLVCGDVGFGKTEVALRAAFATALSGRQVAVVCPTTLLARQHFKTFSERLKGWPIQVRQLSRLVPAKEAALVKEGLREGRIDIVVGTHALLAASIEFKDLGLLVVDEEQHFGVKHKERLKALKADVHVLTLTATPIPRTLQMSLSGLRDLSIISTPPIDRLSVRTYVSPFDPVTIREALLRERYRGGQSFFVVPRLKDLPDAEEFLRNRVPEVSHVLAHGQMGATDLEDRITAFYEGRYDVLLSTPIVESGLDIPTANTMIIHRADMFGLAQLHQLRGRVGRSKTRAYAYLTLPSTWKITPGAEKRLKALQSLDSLGAGFQLASHDLDHRGGGNLLGEEQSGHIRDVGVELFQSMLEEAVAAFKDASHVEEADWSPQINVGVSVLIPDDYVSDLDLRLALYRRVSALETREEREGFAAELIDRFGPLPEEVAHLLDVLEIKALCRRVGVAKIDAGPKGAVASFRESAFTDPTPLVALLQKRPDTFKLRPDQKLFIAGDWPTSTARVRGARKALETLADAAARSAKVGAAA